MYVAVGSFFHYLGPLEHLQKAARLYLTHLIALLNILSGCAFVKMR
jgi:hypothetical protein